MEERFIEVEIEESSIPLGIIAGGGMESLGIDFQELFRASSSRKKKRRVKVKEAREILFNQEVQKTNRYGRNTMRQIKRVEETGIVFIDEIDKIVSPGGNYSLDVSSGGVQRDLLPIVEGSTVLTKYIQARTNHILFIAAGGLFPIPSLLTFYPSCKEDFLSG